MDGFDSVSLSLYFSISLCLSLCHINNFQCRVPGHLRSFRCLRPSRLLRTLCLSFNRLHSLDVQHIPPAHGRSNDVIPSLDPIQSQADQEIDSSCQYLLSCLLNPSICKFTKIPKSFSQYFGISGHLDISSVISKVDKNVNASIQAHTVYAGTMSQLGALYWNLSNILPAGVFCFCLAMRVVMSWKLKKLYEHISPSSRKVHSAFMNVSYS